MGISFEKALGPQVAALSLRSERFEVLADNLANADTPGFQARDIDFAAELTRRIGTGNEQLGLVQTNARHQRFGGAADSSALSYRVPMMPSEDGNTVEVQIEQAELAENNLAVQASMTFLGGRFRGMINAIRGE
ncbi:MAG: flagellar basal body rod protein FlgB [Pseudomonadota bacterium]